MTDNAAIPPILEVRDLCVEFHGEEGVNQAVKSVNFTLKRGRTLAIVGESGSGKSVSCYSILRLIEKLAASAAAPYAITQKTAQQWIFYNWRPMTSNCINCAAARSA